MVLKSKTYSKWKVLTLFLGAFFGVFLGFGCWNGTSVIGLNEANAVVGRPLTPVSYAGVARRTTRRAAYATTAAATTAAAAATVATLPGGCVTSMYGGISYHRCGSIYYQPVYDGPNVVYMEVAPPA